MQVDIAEAQQRHFLLRHLFRWEGRISRRRVQELFGLRGTRASEWIKDFRDRYPTWMAWDSRARLYRATHAAYSELAGPARVNEESASLAQYLALVGIPNAAPATQANRNVIWAAFPDISPPKAHVFAALSEACSTQQVVRVEYRSMREPTPHTREISPHSLVRAGRRWHARAFCSASGGFRDFALGRILHVTFTGDGATQPKSADNAWNTKVEVRLIAHPDLSPEQSRLIQYEYFHDTSGRVDSHRGALVAYFIQDVRAATDTRIQRPPDYQLAVANTEDVAPWLMPT